VIGSIDPRSLETREQVAAFHRGLAETGYVEGRNVAIEDRWADNQIDRLPAMASDLVRERVAVIAAIGGTREYRPNVKCHHVRYSEDQREETRT
jgi:putative ABC transport system substrate-binding protein